MSQDQQVTLALYRKLKQEEQKQLEIEAAAQAILEAEKDSPSKKKEGKEENKAAEEKKKPKKLSEQEILIRNDQNFQKILQAKKSKTSMVGSATMETQQNLR